MLRLWIVPLVVTCASALVAVGCDKLPVEITVANDSTDTVVLRVDDGRYELTVAPHETSSIILDVNYKPRIIEVTRAGDQASTTVWRFDKKSDEFEGLTIVIE
jgi:hypothetical protein